MLGASNHLFYFIFFGLTGLPLPLGNCSPFFEWEGVAELWTFSGIVMGCNGKVQKEKIISKTTAVLSSIFKYQEEN